MLFRSSRGSAPEFKTASLDQWAKAAAKSAPGGDVSALNWTTPEGLTVKPLYTAADTKDLPYADTLPGFESMGWYALVMRRGAPAEIIEKVNATVEVALKDPKVAAGISALTAAPMAMKAPDLQRFFDAEVEKWGTLLRNAGIQPQ